MVNFTQVQNRPALSREWQNLLKWHYVNFENKCYVGDARLIMPITQSKRIRMVAYVNVLAGRQGFLLATASVPSYHGLAMSAVTMRCQKP